MLWTDLAILNVRLSPSCKSGKSFKCDTKIPHFPEPPHPHQRQGVCLWDSHNRNKSGVSISQGMPPDTQGVGWLFLCSEAAVSAVCVLKGIVMSVYDTHCNKVGQCVSLQHQARRTWWGIADLRGCGDPLGATGLILPLMTDCGTWLGIHFSSLRKPSCTHVW